MMKIWHHVPLIIFTLIIPGVVFSYGLNYQGDLTFLLWHLLVGGAFMGVASLHLSKPTATFRTEKNILSSWFSKEAVIFILFFGGIIFQLTFPELRGGGWRFAIFCVGLFGVISTINLYSQSGSIRKWPVVIDFLGEGVFICSVFLLVMWRSGVVNFDSVIVVVLLNLGIIVKLIKEMILGISQYVYTKEMYWQVMSWGMVLICGLFLSQRTFHLFFYPLLFCSSVLDRLKFFLRMERTSLQLHIQEIRKVYLPEKYRQYF